MVGFNRHTPLDGEEKTLGDLIPTLKPPALKPPERRERSARHSGHPSDARRKGSVFGVKSRRELVSTATVTTADWIRSGIAQLLHFQAMYQKTNEE
jgi:hypothetical protein